MNGPRFPGFASALVARRHLLDKQEGRSAGEDDSRFIASSSPPLSRHRRGLSDMIEVEKPILNPRSSAEYPKQKSESEISLRRDASLCDSEDVYIER